jgi:hypothetical protein
VPLGPRKPVSRPGRAVNVQLYPRTSQARLTLRRLPRTRAADAGEGLREESIGNLQ